MDVHSATARVPTLGGHPGPGAGAPFEELFDGVTDLMKRVADTENPEIRKIRAKVHASMAVVKSSWGRGAHAPAAHQGGEFDGEYPDEQEDPALSVALLVGVGIGMIMSIQP